MEFWLEVAAKTVVYAGTLLAVGAIGHGWMLLPQAKDGFSLREQQAMAADADRILLWASSVLVAALVLRALAHTVAAFGLQDAWSWENLRIIAVESRWGAAWQRQVVVAALMLVASLLARIFPQAGVAARLGSVAFCFATPLLGHAAAETSSVAVHGFHVLAAGFWLGTLGCVMLARSDASKAVRPILLRAFAPLAMVSVGFLVATGAFAAWRYLGPLSNLWTTEYGRLLVLKLTGVAVALSLGGANWWRMHRRGSLPRTRAAWTEVVVAGVVVVLTAWLSETGHP